MWCIHTMKYYSAMKRHEVVKHAMTWMQLEGNPMFKLSFFKIEVQLTYNILLVSGVQHSDPTIKYIKK